MIQKRNIAKNLIFILLPLSFFLSSCVLDNINPENGIYWEAPLSDTLTAGLSYNEIEGAIIAGDASGNLYSLYDGSGFENWVRTFSNETIEGVYAGGDYVFCLSRNTNANESRIRKLSLTSGTLDWNTNFSVNIGRYFFVDDYTTGSTRILIPYGSKILAWYPADNHTKIYDFSSRSDSLQTIVATTSPTGTRSYYVADSYGVIIELNSSLSVVQENRDAAASNPIFSGALTIGSTSANGDFLFMGTTNGIKMFQIPALTLQTTLQNHPVGQMMIWDVTQEKLFALLSTYPNSGLACYDPAHGLQELWLSTTSGDVPFSPLALSLSLNLLVYIDDYGYLNIVDSQASTLVSQTYFGTPDVPNLHFAKNALETKLFIPLSTPSKVVAYSLDFTSQNQSSSSSIGF